MNEQIKQARKDFSRIGFSLFAIGAITSVLQIVFSFLWNVSTVGTPLWDADWAMWVISFVPMYLIAVPIGLWIMKKVPVYSPPAVKLGAKHFWMLMLISIPIMYGGNIIGTILSSILSGGTAQNALLDYVMGNPFLTILVAVLIAPFLEEYIFRKQIIDRLGKYGEKTAIFFSALTFGLFHMNLFQFFYAFGLGLIFAYVYTRTRMLRYSVIMHMIINFMGSAIAPALLNILDMETLEAISSGEASMEQIMGALPGLLAYMGYASLLMFGSVAGFVMLIVRWKKRQLLPAPEELPQGTAAKTAWWNWGVVLFTVFCLVMIVIALFSGI